MAYLVTKDNRIIETVQTHYQGDPRYGRSRGMQYSYLSS